MKYGELIAFEPIDSVKVLRDADDLAAARRDVETLVVSPRLAEQLTDVILPNLKLDEPIDAKGHPGRRQLRHRQDPPHVGGLVDRRARRARRRAAGRRRQGQQLRRSPAATR